MCPSRFDLSDPDAFAFCPSCGTGYRAGVTHCSHCRTALTGRAEIERKFAHDHTGVDEAGGMKRVYSTTRPWEAHMLAHALHQHDIAAHVEGEQAGRHLAQPVTIWVPERHYAKAEIPPEFLVRSGLALLVQFIDPHVAEVARIVELSRVLVVVQDQT